MRRAMAIGVAAALAGCGMGVDLSQNCTMSVSVNGGAPSAVECFAAGATSSGTNAVSIAMNGSLPNVNAAQFAMTLPSAPSTGTYGAGNVTTAAAQVQTASGAIYSQSNLGSMGTFSVVLTSVSSASANGGTAYFLHGSAKVTLMGQSGAPGTATISATF